MTVKQLIEALSRVDGDLEVRTEGCCHHCWQEIGRISVEDAPTALVVIECDKSDSRLSDASLD
jgi:hypothetical protein